MPHELAFPASDAVSSADALPPPLACSYANGGLNAASVHVGGELDIATTPQLERTLDAYHARLVVLDLRELAVLDSCGMHAIVSTCSSARHAGRPLVLERVLSGSHLREWGSPRRSRLCGYRHDPVDRGARKGSTP